MPIHFPALIEDLTLGLQHAIARAADAQNDVYRQEGAIKLARMLQADEAAQAAEPTNHLAPLADPGPMPAPGTFDPTIGALAESEIPPVSAAPTMPAGRKPSRQTHGDRAASPEEAAA